MLTLYQICEIISDGVMFPVIHYIHSQSNKLLQNLHFQIFITLVSLITLPCHHYSYPFPPQDHHFVHYFHAWSHDKLACKLIHAGSSWCIFTLSPFG